MKSRKLNLQNFTRKEDGRTDVVQTKDRLSLGGFALPKNGNDEHPYFVTIKW